MNCFMGYNPLVAKDVKITTWIKEFDGEEPVAPIFPAEGDCFIVFATDEDATTHNALSSKTYANGEWVDAEGGSTPTGTIKITENGEHDVSSYATADVDVSGGGGGDFTTAEVTVTINEGAEGTMEMPIVYDGEYSALLTLVPEIGTSTYTVPLFKGEADISVISQSVSITTTGNIEYVSLDGYIAVTGNGTITVS